MYCEHCKQLFDFTAILYKSSTRGLSGDTTPLKTKDSVVPDHPLSKSFTKPPVKIYQDDTASSNETKGQWWKTTLSIDNATAALSQSKSKCRIVP